MSSGKEIEPQAIREVVQELEQPVVVATKKDKTVGEVILEWSQVFIKIVEIVLCTLSLGFAYAPVQKSGLGQSHLHHIGVMYTAYTGLLVVNCLLLVARGIGDRIPYRVVALAAAVGCVLNLVTGILLAVDRAEAVKNYLYPPPHQHMMVHLTIAVVFSFINSVLCAGDVVWTIKRGVDF